MIAAQVASAHEGGWRSVLASATPIGRALFTCGPLAVVLALLLGWRELLVLGFGSLLAVLIGVVWVSRPQPIGVTRTLHPPRITVGESSTGVISVRNTTRRRVGGRFAEDVLGDRVVQLAIPSLAPDESVEEHYTVRVRQRGLFPVGPVCLARRDPLGLFRRVQGHGSVEELWVRPRDHGFVPLGAGWTKDADGPTSELAPRGSAAFHALREYQFGDDFRHVHWRTSARAGQLMVRHYVDTPRTQEAVLLDPRAEVYSDTSFEDAVEIAASVAGAAQRDQRVVHLALPLQPAASQDARVDVLDRLATVGRVGGHTAREALLVDAGALRGCSALVIVTGDAIAEEVSAQGRRMLPNGLVVVVRVVPGHEPSVGRLPSGPCITVPSAERAAAAWADAMKRRRT